MSLQTTLQCRKKLVDLNEINSMGLKMCMKLYREVAKLRKS